jgi:hypothetical protein
MGSVGLPGGRCPGLSSPRTAQPVWRESPPLLISRPCDSAGKSPPGCLDQRPDQGGHGRVRHRQGGQLVYMGVVPRRRREDQEPTIAGRRHKEDRDQGWPCLGFVDRAKAILGWHGRAGCGDGDNQFHCCSLTGDHRFVFGGYDAQSNYSCSDLSAGRDNERTRLEMARRRPCRGNRCFGCGFRNAAQHRSR